MLLGVWVVPAQRPQLSHIGYHRRSTPSDWRAIPARSLRSCVPLSLWINRTQQLAFTPSFPFSHNENRNFPGVRGIGLSCRRVAGAIQRRACSRGVFTCNDDEYRVLLYIRARRVPKTQASNQAQRRVLRLHRRAVRLDNATLFVMLI